MVIEHPYKEQKKHIGPEATYMAQPASSFTVVNDPSGFR
jgi:hypothetical protein